MLSIRNVRVRYGPIEALHDISLEVNEGEVVTLIGSNGAGKTTTLGAVSGLLPLAGGQIHFDGHDITSLAPHKRVPLGLIQVPEGRRIFGTMTVAENLDLGAYARTDRANLRNELDEIYALFPRLAERRNQAAGTMSGGEQQMLAVGRALMSRPKLLLLDEPSLGLAPLLVKEIFAVVKRIRAKGVTVLLVEQNAHKALEVADRAYVLETGHISMTGDAKTLANDPRIKAAYLGA
ncbi:high-affinity branched-chain amino acid transport ATP-binding protein LivF [Abditibacteriota bacterium]|nr:high-affinity branched-chain amino acid transport ATP-binding protein LivF [Abditibacteriota bacterium]